MATGYGATITVEKSKSPIKLGSVPRIGKNMPKGIPIKEFRTAMIHDTKLDFWLQHKFNVLFIGKHGVGKTAMVKACFERAGLVLHETFLYFSVSTLDPWVDLIGVPKEVKGEDGITYLDLVRPKQLAFGKVKAMFFDELNRPASKKILNAVMEMIQFKSINGKVFPNLEVIWGAINPIDENETYDVQRLDPAQEDRFHVKVEVPYKPSITYFSQVYGHKIAQVALSWWKELPPEQQDLVSPRRLDYALMMNKIGGDLHDVLPQSSLPSKLVQALGSEPVKEVLVALHKTKDTSAAVAYLSIENNYTSAIPLILKSPTFMYFFLPLINKEKLVSLITTDDKVCKYVAHQSKMQIRFQETLDEIMEARTNKSLCTKIDGILKTKLVSTGSLQLVEIPPHFTKDPIDKKTWQQQLAEIKKWNMYKDGTKAHNRIVQNIPAILSLDEVLWTLDVIDTIAKHSYTSTFCGRLSKLINVSSHCAGQLSKTVESGWKEIITDHTKRCQHLITKLTEGGYKFPVCDDGHLQYSPDYSTMDVGKLKSKITDVLSSWDDC